eukprot:CAMPEP_0173436256 /NCGR_PEP_ID=MMETSP1357-20121228/15846_1 /TAXON_ID=77926 /ORGANISM="Hemiselmis rufescens, Strain PCC563" /LENGTH=206 /DNA_ID=CAMNT_0014401319 /DNA_START=122 /DNA_END=738 /DNA_ORIENTATION=-
MGFFFDSFDAPKCKTNIKLACNRINLLRTKKLQVIDKQRREIATLLQTDKVDLARVKVEHVIREQGTADGLDMLSAMADLLLARFPLVEKTKKGEECVADIRELVATLMWSAPRSDIQELLVVAKQLKLKYGEAFWKEAENNNNSCVNGRIFFLLSYRTPPYHEIQKCLGDIAKQHGVAWSDDVPAPLEVDGFAPSAPASSEQPPP